MNAIQFSENANTQLIPFQDNVSLCDFENPQLESDEWILHQTIQFSKIVCVGLGAGFHVNKLSELHPEHEILVIETRPNLIHAFRAAFPNCKNVQIQVVENFGDLAEFMVFEELTQINFDLVSFKKSWGSSEKVYKEILWFLTSRTAESFMLLSELFKFKSNLNSKNQLLSVANLYSEHQNYTLSSLQELIK